jgi:hypothetical protein
MDQFNRADEGQFIRAPTPHLTANHKRYQIMKNHCINLLKGSATLATAAFILTVTHATAKPSNERNGNWPDRMLLPLCFLEKPHA